MQGQEKLAVRARSTGPQPWERAPWFGRMRRQLPIPASASPPPPPKGKASCSLHKEEAVSAVGMAILSPLQGPLPEAPCAFFLSHCPSPSESSHGQCMTLTGLGLSRWGSYCCIFTS